MNNDFGANITLKKDAKITFIYIFSSTMLYNSIGVFTFRTDQLATLKEIDIKDTIFFPNFNDSYYDGPLSYGDSVSTGQFYAGDSIGFSLVQNFWDGVSKNPARKADNSTHGNVITKCKQVFRTIKRLNPEPNDSNNLNQHTLLFNDLVSDMLVIGMENLNRSNDSLNDFSPWLTKQDVGKMHDFNDVIMGIYVDPPDAVDKSCIPDLDTGLLPDACNKKKSTPSPGISGPTLWRETYTPSVENDPIKEALAKERAAQLEKK